MATQNEVKIGINVSDNGTARKTIKNFEEITTAANTAKKAAAGINTPVGGTNGSRAVYAKAAPTGSQAMMSGEDYGRARGSAGATGAGARDFANQAQGLGGLVRLYATYAANIFAVSAAFTALSNAMDTANMVKGLDQLGAASGVALGSLSKNLVAATGGAISLRDAMTATAKASSSGMSSEQILRMGKVAQQASQALGVDMTDAISRISRGITKLEPELLDELGLFTKTGKAAEDYAKNIGKSVTELTDFERRAAFANAVLEEGEKKFSQINLDVNPYTKLLASIKDLAQTSLEFVNKGLAPIVSYLSNSPTALGLAIASLGTVLIKQALPALGEFKAGLASAADRATQLSVQKAQDAGKARLAIDARILSQVESLADDKIAAVDAAEQKIQAIEASGLNKRSAAYKLLQKDINDVTKADIDAVEARAKVAEKAGDSKRAAAYREATSAVLEAQRAEEDLIVTKEKLAKQFEKDAQGMTTYGATIRAAEKAQSAATAANIVSNAAYNGSLIGVTASMTLMRAEMQAAGVATNTFAGKLLLARGALAAVGGMVSTVMAAFGPLMLIITAVSLAFSLLDGALSKNSKESAALSNSLDALDANASHLTKTIDVINKKPFLERMSPESLKVKATALGEVSSAISTTITDLLKADKAASGWDKFLDGFKTIWSGDMLSKTSKSLATGITDSLSKIAGSPEAKALNKELSAILKIDTETANFQEVQDAIKKIGQESPQKLKLVEEGFKKISLASQVTAAKGTELVDAFKKLGDIKQTISNKFLPTDDVTKFGQELIATSQKLAVALDDPQQKLNAIIQLSANATSIPGATLEQVVALNKAADLSKNILTLEAQQLDNKQKLIDKQEELAKLVGKERAASIVAGKQTQVSGLNQEGLNQVDKLKADLKEIKSAGEINVKVKTELTSKLEGYTKEIETATLGTYKAGADLVAKQISAEFIKAGKVVSDAYVSIIGETEATIKIKADSEKAVVNAQLQQILSQRDLTIATRELALQLQKKSLEDYLQNNREGREGVQLKLAALEPQIQAVEAAKTGDFSKLKLSTDAKDLKKLNVEGDAFAQNMRASAAAASNLRAQIKAIDITALDATTRIKFEPEKRKLTDSEKSVALAKQELDVQGKLVTQGNISFISAKQALETKQLELQQDTALLDNKVQIARQEKIIGSDASKAIKDAAIAKKAELLTAAETLKTQQQQQKTTLANSQVQEKMGALAFNVEEARKREAENAELALSKKSEELKLEQDLFGMYSSIGLLSETQKINQKFLLDQKSAELDYEQKIAKLKNSSGQQMGALDAREEAVWTQIGAGTGNQAALIEELDRIAQAKALITARTNEEAAAAGKVRDNTIGIANAVKTAGLEQERYNELLNTSNDFANTLKMGFEGAAESSQKIAAALGGVATTMAEVAVNADNRAKSEKLAQENVDKAWKTMDYDKVVAAEKEQAELKKKNAKQELADDIKTVNSAKKLFKEKTAAYKILNGIEKVMHVTKLAMDAKELAVKLGSLATGTAAKAGAEAADTSLTLSGTMSRLGAYAAEIYGKTIGQLGPIVGPAVATALVAAMFAMFGKGGGGSAPAFTATSEQLQETQGTGMTWNAKGEKVATGGGIFGDDEAKANSVVKSLEILRDNSFESLSYDNKLLRSFKSISSAITKATNVAVTSGLRTVPVELAATLGTSKDKNDTTGIGIIDSILGSVLGGDYTENRTLQNRRLELQGTFDSVSNDMSNGLKLITDVLVKWEEDGGWFGGDDAGSFLDTITSQVDPALQTAFTNIFAYFKDGYTEIASMLKKEDPLAFVTEKLKAVNLVDSQGQPLKLDLTGLTSAEEIRSELEAYFSQINNIAVKSLFPQFSKFETAGEDYGTTVIRVIQNTDQVRLALLSMGNSFDIMKDRTTTVTREIPTFFGPIIKITETFGESAYDIADALIEAADGLDNFVDQTKFFTDNFLTEAERLAPVQKAVTAEMARLAAQGITSADGLVDTREEFKNLVLSLDLSTIAGREAYQSLMNVQEGFAQITPEAQAAGDSLDSLYYQILKLTGSSADILAADRSQIMSKTPEDQKALQQYIFALEDVKTAEANLTKARQAEVTKLKQQKSTTESTINSLKNYIESLKKFKDSLLLGAASPLTPAEKYAESKRQFDAILATAMGTAITPAEKAAKDVALSQLEGASTAFLDASRIYNASSAQYTTDFNLVQRALTDSGDSLALQLSVEQKTLDELESQTSLLESQIAALEALNSSTLSVADAIAALDLATSAAASAKEAVGPGGTFQLYSPGGGKILGNTVYGLNGLKGTLADAKTGTMNYAAQIEAGTTPASELRRIYVEDWGLDSKALAHIIGKTQQEVLDWFKLMDPSLPEFAVGTNFVPEDMVAQIHQGERIIPAADNEELMANIGNRNRTNEVLVAEIKKLNQEMKVLQKAVADGAVINAQATERNTVEISRTVKDTGSTASHTEAIRRRTQIV